MGFSTLTRKVELVRTQLTQRDIAKECGVDESLVSYILGGERWGHPAAPRVMECLASHFGVPVEEAFPGATMARQGDRRHADRRSA